MIQLHYCFFLPDLKITACNWCGSSADVSLWTSVLLQVEFNHTTPDSTLPLGKYQWLWGKDETVCP